MFCRKRWFSAQVPTWCFTSWALCVDRGRRLTLEEHVACPCIFYPSSPLPCSFLLLFSPSLSVSPPPSGLSLTPLSPSSHPPLCFLPSLSLCLSSSFPLLLLSHSSPLLLSSTALLLPFFPPPLSFSLISYSLAAWER